MLHRNTFALFTIFRSCSSSAACSPIAWDLPVIAAVKRRVPSLTGASCLPPYDELAELFPEHLAVAEPVAESERTVEVESEVNRDKQAPSAGENTVAENAAPERKIDTSTD